MSAPPRVMYLVCNYPSISESYIRREIEVVARDHDVAIVARNDALVPYHEHLPYTVQPDRDAVCELVEDFRPDVLHSHWLFEAPTIAYVSERTGVPFTIRTHSYDTLWGGARGKAFDVVPGRPASRLGPARVRSAARLLDDDLCIGVICFPFVRPRLRKFGVADAKLRDCYPVVDVDRFLDRSPNGDGVMNCGPALRKKAMDDLLDIAQLMPGTSFSLYAIGHTTDHLVARNAQLPDPVTIPGPVDNDAMPAEYKKHRWLLKTGDFRRRTMGWPTSIAEAQASGVGVCMANLGPDLREYVGPGGFLYDSIAEARDILSRPFPDELREASFEHAQRSNIADHAAVLTDLWAPAFRRSTAS
jgi:hypothetical protein